MTDAWRGRVALITGASSGIGAAVARRLAEAGMTVALVARRAARLEALAAELAEAGAQASVHVADLTDEAQILRAFAAVRAQHGGVDVLVNNAGLGRRAALVDGETAHWREMLDLNVLALCVCTREAVKDMRARGAAGHVFHISSMSAHRVTGPGSGVYSASKHAVRALTEALRQELRALSSPIRVTAISPGFVETEFAEVYNHGDGEAARKTYAQFEVLRAEDVAQALAYALCTPAHVQVHDILMRPTDQPT